MAKIVLGLGTSHTPMLLASDETLPRFLETDQNFRHRDKEGRPATYGRLCTISGARPKRTYCWQWRRSPGSGPVRRK